MANDIKKDGGAAFPCCGNPDTDQMVHGMTLRDWYAGMALQGFISATPESMAYPGPEEAAEFSFKYADAMIKARGE